MSPSLALIFILLVSTLNVFATLRSLPAATKNSVWCVAKQGATDVQLQENLDWLCSDAGGFRNCTPIQPGGECFDPNTLRDHASFVMNEYYQMLGHTDEQCDFSGTGHITYNDPSHGACHFISW